MVNRGEHNLKLIGNPMVSVLLSVYNESPIYLENCIMSILEQTYPNFELIILDDGSTDEATKEALLSFAGMDPRIRLFKEPHRGLTKTLNRGLRLCRGEFVCRQDSDDWSARNRFERQVAFLLDHPEISVAGSYVLLHRQDGTPLWVAQLPSSVEEVNDALPFQNPFCHGATCFRREDAEAVGGYREELVCAQDYDFFWRLCERGGGVNLPEVLYHHRYTNKSISTTKSHEQARVTIVTRQLARMRQSGQKENVQQAFRQAEREVALEHLRYAGLLRHGDYVMLAGDYTRAFSVYLKCLISKPFRFQGWAKLLRWMVFVTVPPLRKRLFLK